MLSKHAIFKHHFNNESIESMLAYLTVQPKDTSLEDHTPALFKFEIRQPSCVNI